MEEIKESFKYNMNKKQKEIFDLLILELNKNNIGWKITDNFYLSPSKHYFEMFDDLSFLLELNGKKQEFEQFKFKKDIKEFINLIK